MVIEKIDRLTISRSLEREKRDNVIETSIINLSVLYQVYMIYQTITLAVKQLTQIPTNSDLSGEVYMSSEGETFCHHIMPLNTLSRECDRYGVSNTVGATIAIEALVAYEFVTDEDKKFGIWRIQIV